MEPTVTPAEASPFGALRHAALRRWPLVLLVTLVSLGAAVAGLARRDDSYTATAKLLIVPLPQYDTTYFGTRLLRDAGDPKLTAATAAEVLHSRDIGAQAARAAGGGATTSSVLDAVDVQATGDTNVLRVVATAGSAQRAAQLASSFVAAALDVRARIVATDLDRRIAILTARRSAASGSVPADQLQALRSARSAGGDPTLQVAQLPGPAKAAGQTPAPVVLVLALLGGLFVGVLAAIGLDRLSGRVRDEDDVLRIYNLPVWSRVPAAPRRLRGAGPIAPSAMTPGGEQAFQTLSMQIGRWAPQGGVIALVSSCDGDGRTTTAVNVATNLAAGGRSTALILLDPAPDAASMADAGAAGVHVVTAEAETLRPLSETVEAARRRADLVVIDGPPMSRGADLVATAVTAQLVLVVRMRETARRQLRQARDVLEEIGARPVGLVLVGTGGRAAQGPMRERAGAASAGREAQRAAAPRTPPDADALGARCQPSLRM